MHACHAKNRNEASFFWYNPEIIIIILTDNVQNQPR
jgi:hypothetical protein